MALNVGHWLRKTPRPHTVLADERRIDVGNTPGKWLNLVRTIESLSATKITCLDSAGNVIRAITLDEDEDVTTKTEESELQTFARLVADAYEKGSKSYAPLLDNAMQFIERQGQRLAAMEREIERLRMHAAKLQAELLAATATVPVEDESLTAALITGMMQGAGAANANPGNNLAKVKGAKAT